MIALWIFLAFTPKAYAFAPINHEQITRAALRYVLDRPGEPVGFAQWIKPLDPKLREWLEQILVRGSVDPDFQDNMWGEVMGYGPVTGGAGRGRVILFTSFLHFLNVHQPGRYWEYDGYGYPNAGGDAYDRILGFPFSTILMNLSPPLSGMAYRRGFKGTDADWHHLYSDSRNLTRAIFPPADVSAELAYEDFMRSPLATAHAHSRELRKLTAVSGVMTGVESWHWYWRGEFQGFPSKLYELGTALHMAQDMGVPHHTQGTLDFCHAEFEAEADSLSCGRRINPKEYEPYQDGSYPATRVCQRLYHAPLVASLLKHAAPLQLTRAIALGQRIVELARITAHWQWGDPKNSVDLVATELPDGKVFTADRCLDLVQLPEVRQQMRLQFNLAVAATVALLDLAARERQLK